MLLCRVVHTYLHEQTIRICMTLDIAGTVTFNKGIVGHTLTHKRHTEAVRGAAGGARGRGGVHKGEGGSKGKVRGVQGVCISVDACFDS